MTALKILGKKLNNFILAIEQDLTNKKSKGPGARNQKPATSSQRQAASDQKPVATGP
jgi:hypothetical protein